ncbi:hypothetical protein SALBM311S_10869 [Streptomyces alboniger]
MDRLGQQGRARHVHIQGRQPLLAGGSEAVVDIRAGEVHEDVQPAEPLDGTLDEVGHLRVVGDVGRDEENALPDFVRQFQAAILVDVRDDDIRPRRMKCADDRFPDNR